MRHATLLIKSWMLIVPLLVFIIGFSQTVRSQCEIWNVDVFVQPCEEGFFYVELGFWHENTGSEGFRVQGNGNNYGNFEYEDLPITIGPLEGDGVTEYEFVVIDNEFEDCSDWAAIDPVECPGGGDCAIWDLVVDDHPCDSNGIFYAYLNFEYENVSEAGFRLYINYEFWGEYTYDQLPLWEVGPLIGDGSTVYHFMVVDLENENCAEDLNFGPIDCGGTPGCNIWDVEADVMPCDEAGYFNVLIDFDFVNVGFDGFSIHGSGMNHGNYEYEDIPILIGPLLGDGTTVYEFIVTDLEFQDCSSWTAIDPVDCSTPDCIIGEMETTILPCDANDEFSVLLDFAYAHTSDGFSVQGNGANYGNFLYANLPIEIGPLTADGITTYEFLVQDDVHEGCSGDTYIDPINCDSLTQMINFSTQVVSCNDEMYELQLNFDVINPGDEGFVILGNGEDYGTFMYNDLPITIGPLETDGSTAYHFIALDRENMHNGNWDRLIPFTCGSLGIDNPDKATQGVQVYPNPSKGSLKFISDSEAKQDITIYNSAGSVVRSFSMKKQHQIKGLHPGIYYFRASSGKLNSSSGTIIVTE